MLRGTIDVFRGAGSQADAVVLAGEFERAEAQQLRLVVEELLERREATVELDLRLVTFFGAAGLAALESADAVARRSGSSLSIGATSSIARLAVSTVPQLRHLLDGSVT